MPNAQVLSRFVARAPDWRAAIFAGLAAGAVEELAAMILLPIFAAGGPLGLAHMTAAILLGPEALPPPTNFVRVIVAALVIHFLLAIMYAVALAWIIERWSLPFWAALLAGAGFGLALCRGITMASRSGSRGLPKPAARLRPSFTSSSAFWWPGSM